MTTQRTASPPIRDRARDLDRLIAICGSQIDLAEALETTQETISRWIHGRRGIPAYVSLLVEMLESTPEDKWPRRWRR